MYCICQVKSVYVNFLSHCYIDTEVEVKEIYTSPSMWTLFENFLVDMGVVSRCILLPHNASITRRLFTAFRCETVICSVAFFWSIGVLCSSG